MKARICSSLEALEPRVAPAGLVAMSLKAGILTLKTVPGEDGNEVVAITQLPNGDFSVTPGVDVVLRFDGADSTTPVVIPGPVLGLSANLGSGNDSLTLDGAHFSRGVKISLGDGENFVSINNTFFGSKVSITGGDGLDSISATGAQVHFGGTLTASLGDGINSISLTANSVALGNGMKFTGGAGNDTVQLGTTDTAVFVLGAVNVAVGDGVNSMTAGASGGGRVDIAGAFSFKGGKGSDSIALAGTRFAAGAMRLNLGDGANAVTSTATDFVTDRNLTIAALNGSDTLDFQGSTLRVFGNLSLSLRDGPSVVELGPSDLLEVSGVTKVKAGSSDPDASRLNFNSRDLLLNGPVTASLGDGFGSSELFYNGRVFLGAGAKMHAGEATGTFGIRGNGEFVSHGSISLKAAGDALLTVFGSGRTMIDGNVTVVGGSRASVSGVGVLTGSVLLAPGNPSAGTELSATLEGFTNTGLRVGGNVTMKVPTSADQTGFVFVRGVFTLAPIQITTGAGADRVFFGELRIGSSVKVDLGAGADQFDFDIDSLIPGSTVVGPMTVLGGTGADVFTLSGSTAATNGIEFRNRVLIDGGADTDSLTVGTQATFDPEFPLEQKNIP